MTQPVDSGARTYRVAILGCRGRGTAAARAYAAHPRTQIVGLCDLVPERLQVLGDELGIAARYDDLDAMIREQRPDLVAIPTGTEFHHPLARRVLAHGCHIDVEKPICTTLEEADDLIQMAGERGLRIAVHHQSRVGRSMRALREQLRSGAIGEVRHVQGSCKGYYAGYGMQNIGTHLTNNLMSFLGPCRAVTAVSLTGGRRSEAENVVVAAGGMGTVLGERVTATLEFDGGVTSTLLFHRFPRVDNEAYHFEVLGTEGRLFWKMRGLWRLGIPHFVPGSSAEWESVPIPGLPGFEGETRAEQDELAYVDDFVTALDTNRAPECSGEAGRHAVEINFGIFEAAAYGRRVTLPQVDRSHPLLRWRAEQGLGAPAAGPRDYREWLESVTR
ncbi:MAG: Gfo/Idh/MocA family oxidoreductase [Armatimonadetes bacterium]|nr:Gfo/Idh/MocA family oxidoreductase [Armatimonadota bacterium]